MHTYEISYNRNGKGITVRRRGANAVQAIDSICNQYGWRSFLRQYDAGTRGQIWAVMSADTNGGFNPDIRITADEI